MKGFVKIEAVVRNGKEGLSVTTELQDMSYVDRMQMLHALCHALKLNPVDLQIMAEMMQSKTFNRSVTIEHVEDSSEQPAGVSRGNDVEELVGLLKTLLS